MVYDAKTARAPLDAMQQALEHVLAERGLSNEGQFDRLKGYYLGLDAEQRALFSALLMARLCGIGLPPLPVAQEGVVAA